MGKTHRAGNLSSFVLSLALGVASTMCLYSVLATRADASDPWGEIAFGNPARQTLGSPTALTTNKVRITKTVEPPHPDTGSVVSICFAISGLGPRSLDVILAQDVSGSMDDPIEEDGTQTRLKASQAAASAFASFLPDTDRIGVVSYTTTARVAQPLTITKSAITRTIYDLTTKVWTNIGDGIRVSHGELITSPRYVSNTIKTIILLSDGVANCDETGDCRDDSDMRQRAAEYARTRATLAASDTIRIYTVGFGNDADEELLQDIAEIGGGSYFFAPGGDVLKSIYLTIAVELHHLIVTDILTPGVETDCSRWPDGQCLVGSGGVTTLTFPISDSLLVDDPAIFCLTATANLDPNYEGPINLDGSGICYQDSEGHVVCEAFNKPTVTVGGRRIGGYVFYDLNGDGHQDADEAAAPQVVVHAASTVTSATLIFPAITTTTDISGGYVLRTSSESTLSVAIGLPPGYVATMPISEEIPAATGIYTVVFGIRVPLYLPLVIKEYPLPTIINGGFEDGWTGWTHGGELAQMITSTNPYTGSFSALLGHPAYVCQGGVPVGTAWIEQVFYVPHTDDPRLSFWYRVITQDTNPLYDPSYDKFNVWINGVLLFEKIRISNVYGCAEQEKEDMGWQSGEIDLSGYRGERIVIRFENRNGPDGWYNTWTFVDVVRFAP